MSGSLSLLSDALHNASDVAALVVSWLAQRLARRTYSDHHTFGYKCAEIVAERFGIHPMLLEPEYAAEHDTALVADSTQCAGNAV